MDTGVAEVFFLFSSQRELNCYMATTSRDAAREENVAAQFCLRKKKKEKVDGDFAFYCYYVGLLNVSFLLDFVGLLGVQVPYFYLVKKVSTKNEPSMKY